MMAVERLASSDGILTSEVRIIPAKRTAAYDVPLAGDSGVILTAKVQAKDITLTNTRGPGRGDGIVRLPKTLEAVRNAIVLLEAVEAELLAQGVTE